MGIIEKIADIEREIARTQKNKEYHLGILKAKLAKYRAELLDIKSGGGGGKGEGFDVMKSGDARVALIGFPSVGKSTLLNKVTKTESAAAAYEFTTLTCIPGNIEYEGANIQLLDLPGIIEGAAQGKGRGKQVIAVARTADLVLMMLDATRGPQQRRLLEAELEAVGIRLNRVRPNISFRTKSAGGIGFTATVRQSYLTEKFVQTMLHEYKIFHAEVIVREDCTMDDFIDVVVGNRKYLKCLYCYNKIDQIGMEDLDRLAREPNTVVVSCEMNLNLDFLIRRIWEELGLLRLYTKKRGEYPDFEDGVIIRAGSSVEHLCHRIHRQLPSIFKFALVWGTSAKHQPQKVGIQHRLQNEDVIQIVKKQ
ncbi:Developmentally-regulated gtp-binding protein 2 [Paramicrosporidium saccamoebae]|uniref:Developmentally-regulated gtp-binding protein 2 n=1 Tax=Paramicrosporidium saccamoebae TaxID=1246581 RepID=A0A2H9TPP0_9FUNG|nr:Developmentally-regulated gtp-binding protein 2 [Paramicrosporidium saccamoebae]